MSCFFVDAFDVVDQLNALIVRDEIAAEEDDAAKAVAGNEFCIGLIQFREVTETVIAVESLVAYRWHQHLCRFFS